MWFPRNFDQIHFKQDRSSKYYLQENEDGRSPSTSLTFLPNDIHFRRGWRHWTLIDHVSDELPIELIMNGWIGMSDSSNSFLTIMPLKITKGPLHSLRWRCLDRKVSFSKEQFSRKRFHGGSTPLLNHHHYSRLANLIVDALYASLQL